MGVALEAVVFDWGGTLAEFVPLEMTDVWTLAAARLAPRREEEVAERLCAVEARFWERTAGACRSATLADLVAEATAELGLDVAQAVLEEAALGHLDAWTPHIRHFAEAEPTLRELRRRRLRLGLLSNTHWPRAFHERFLARDGLVEHLDFRLYTSEMSHLKPHPSVFRAALDALGAPEPAAVAFVGDRPYDDVWGAQRAGMRTVWVANDHVEPWDVVPDAVIATLEDLPAAIDAWR